jgi:hypothetical protein
MTNQLEHFYFNIALETARAESEAANVNVTENGDISEACMTLTRAEAIAHSTPSSLEVQHLAACRMCTRLVQNFSAARTEKAAPAVTRLFDALRRYGKSTEELAREWIAIAKANARIFSYGSGEWAFQEDVSLTPREFQIEGFVVRLDLREEIGQLVLEVSTADENWCGETLTVVLLGGTGEEQRVPVTLSGRKGTMCYGSGVANGKGSDVIEKLGPVIVPVVVGVERPLKV